MKASLDVAWLWEGSRDAEKGLETVIDIDRNQESAVRQFLLLATGQSTGDKTHTKGRIDDHSTH